MTPGEVLARLERTGITLTLDGSDLVARPTSAVDGEIVEILRENKADLVEALQARMQALASASSLGLVAQWSREFGYISIHDPTTGEWHDISWKDAPEWAKWEARKRKELWKAGNRRAFDLKAAEMEEIWKAEHPEEEEGIVEEHPLEDEF